MGLWQRYLSVRSDDIVRQTINRGFLQVVALLALLALIGAVTSAILGEPLRFVIAYVAYIPLAAAAALLARRGGLSGASLLALTLAVLIVFAYRPTYYVEPIAIHVLFLLPAIIAALFVHPRAGFAVIAVQVVLFGAALLLYGIDAGRSARFLTLATINLAGMMVPVYVGARLFRETVGSLNRARASLDAQVSAQTADVRRLKALREHDITAVVHDIHNHMQLVRSAVDELLMDAEEAGADTAALARAERRAGFAMRAAVSLVNDLRTAVLLENAELRVQRQPTDLALLVQGTVDQFATQIAQADIRVTLEIADDTPLVWVDSAKLERVLVNLIGNAIKYTHPARSGAGEIYLQLGPAENGVRLVIRDNGRGMDATALARLGRPFTRLASARGTDGMGIGVYISRGIVELHGGSLSFASAGPGQGTAATIWLPIRGDIAAEREESELEAGG